MAGKPKLSTTLALLMAVAGIITLWRRQDVGDLDPAKSGAVVETVKKLATALSNWLALSSATA